VLPYARSMPHEGQSPRKHWPLAVIYEAVFEVAHDPNRGLPERGKSCRGAPNENFPQL
jgi:hypothetical protein